ARLEEQLDDRHARIGLRLDVLDVVDDGRRVALDLGGDAPRHLVRGHAGVLERHGDDRDADVGKDVGRHSRAQRSAQQGQAAQQRKQQREHDEGIGAPQRQQDYPHEGATPWGYRTGDLSVTRSIIDSSLERAIPRPEDGGPPPYGGGSRNAARPLTTMRTSRPAASRFSMTTSQNTKSSASRGLATQVMAV